MQNCGQCGSARVAAEPNCAVCGAPFPGWKGTSYLNLLLRATGEPLGEAEWLISRQEVVVGRGHAADLDLAHDSVSRRHARLSRVAAGFQIEDLDSRNGTQVNGERIVGVTPLSDGDRVAIGDVHLAVLLIPAEPPAQIAARSPFATLLVDVSADALSQIAGTGPGQGDAEEGDTTKTTPMPVGEQLLWEGQEAETDASLPSDQPAEDEHLPGEVPANEEMPHEGSSRIAFGNLADQAVAVAIRLRQLQEELSVAAELLDRAGGRSSLDSVISRVQRVKEHPLDVGVLLSMAEVAESAELLLQCQSILVDVLFSADAGDQLVLSGDGEVQSD
ncbi:MAG: FHA domain-containing protein [Chloroflexi bacterium]|nr:FHA domain-containing protein [Chloroflexota bacterium]